MFVLFSDGSYPFADVRTILLGFYLLWTTHSE